MKKITYCKEANDFEMTYEGHLVGYAKTHSDAERILDQYVYDLLNKTVVLDEEVLAEVIEEAICKAPQMDHQIKHAVTYIKSNPITMVGDAVLIKSSRGEKVYHTNGHCQCEAYINHRTCWHRIAARLVKRCLERQAECDICQGIMTLTYTPAGEDIWECKGCGHCVMVEIRKAA